MTTRRLLVSLLLALPCAAQVHLVPLPMRGAMPAFQAGIVFDHEPGVIRRKQANLGRQMLTFPAGPESPEYDAAAALAMLKSMLEMSPDAPLEIDAMSSGNDLLPATYDAGAGVFRIGFGNVNGWATLYLTFEDGPPFAPSADVFGYYFDNPDFPAQLRNGMYHELVRADHLVTSAPLPATAGIRALDINMGLIQSANGRRDIRTLPVADKMFFSVTPPSGTLIHIANHGPWAGRGVINGAAIFVANYDGLGQLQSVDLHQTGTELGLPTDEFGVPIELTDIDALGVAYMIAPGPARVGQEQVQGGTWFYLVSFGDGQSTEELQVIATTTNPFSTNPPPAMRKRAPLRTLDGLSLVGMGGLTRRVKSVCAQDPETTTGGYAMGVPARHPLPPPVATSRLNLSLTAEGEAVGLPGDDFTIYGTLTGGVQQIPTAVGLVVDVVGFGPTFFLEGLWLPAAGPYQIERQITIPVPPGWPHFALDYEVMVVTVDAFGLPELSHRSLLHRSTY